MVTLLGLAAFAVAAIFVGRAVLKPAQERAQSKEGVLTGAYAPCLDECRALRAVWLLLVITTRDVSVASMGAAAVLPLLTLWGSWHHGRIQDGTWNKPLFVFSVIIAVLAIWKHRSNIQRLREGTENRFERKRA